MLKIREIICKTVLNKSGLADFTLNCYVGCTQRCIYCYARFMKKFKARPEDWGYFVDVKVNAPEVLAKEIKKINPPKKEVFMSSICDGWQPLEAKYKLSQTCLRILLEAGFSVSILTKSSLILRDIDLLAAYKPPSLLPSPCTQELGLGMTITTLNSRLQKLLEPCASGTPERINILKIARQKGIKTWVFLGPLIPEFTDGQANLEAIFRALTTLNLDQIHIDRLNPRWGVLDSLKRGLSREDYTKLRLLIYKCSNPAKYLAYSRDLKEKAAALADKYNLSDKVTFCF